MGQAAEENATDAAPNWPQFRGPNGSGVADKDKPPVNFDASSNVLWSVPVPQAPSSPCIWGDRIFLTAFADQTLQTICLRRKDGSILWRQTAPSETIEPMKKGMPYCSPAASTPVTDGKHIFVYFGSCGALCYDFEGKEIWRRILPTVQTFDGFGTGTSPVLAEGLLFLNRDQMNASELVALDAQTGQIAWRADRGISHSWCTPVIWTSGGQRQVVLPASNRLLAYNLKTGEPIWNIPGIASVTCSTPVAGKDMLYVSSWSTMDAKNPGPTFESIDKNGDGKLTLEELPEVVSFVFQSLDLNKDGVLSREEYETFRNFNLKAHNVFLAVKPGGHGDIGETHVAWKQVKSLAYVPSPLFYRDRVYTIRDGGLVACYESQSGNMLFDERVGVQEAFYASPVAADGHIYVASFEGSMVVVEAADTLKVLARNKLQEQIMATPAIVDNKLYVRTDKHLFAFGSR